MSDFSTDPAFLKASPDDQRAYLSHIDPDFAKAQRSDQDAYLAHVTGRSVLTRPPSGAPGGSPAVGPPVGQPSQSAPPTVGPLAKTWQAANDPSYMAHYLGVAPEMARLERVRDQAIASGDSTKAYLTELQRRDIDPQSGFTKLLTPLTGATMVAGPVLEQLGTVGRAGEAALATAFGAPAAKDILQGQQPGETYTESLTRRAGDVGQVFLSALGVVGALAHQAPAVDGVPPAAKDPGQAFAQQSSLPREIDKPNVVAPKPQAAGDRKYVETMDGIQPVPKAPPSTAVESAIQPPSDTSNLDDQYLGAAMGKRDALRGYQDEKTFAQDSPIGRAYKQAWNSADNARQANMAAEPIPAPIAPTPTQGLDGLTAEQQDIAAEALKRIDQKATAAVSPDEAPLRKMVEDAGGKWRGMDSMGLAHYDAPSDMVGREGVSIASPISKMDPDFIQSEFARKAQEFANTPAAPTPQTQPQTLQPAAKTGPRSPEPPITVSQLFNRIAQYSSDFKNATNETDRNAARFQQISLTKQAADMIRQHIVSLGPNDLNALRDYSNKIASDNANQADFIDKAVEQHNRTAPARAEMATMRKVGYTEQAKGEASGELEGLSVERQAETAPLSRSIMDQLQGRRPRVTMDDLAIRQTPKGMSDDQWSAFSAKLKDRIQNEHDAILRDSQILLDTHGSIEDSDIPGRLRELDRDVRMLGKFPAAPASPGARPGTLGAELAPAEGITLARAQQLLGRKVNKIPEMNEFSQKADQLRELANLHKGIVKAVDSRIGLKPVPRAAERGAVGEAAEKHIVDADVVEPSKMMAKAKELGYDTWKPSDNKPAGPYGWLSEDGKSFIRLKGASDPAYTQQTGTHAGIAESLLPELASPLHDTASNALLQNGWVRMVLPHEFEAHTLSDKQIDTLEHNMIQQGTYGQPMIIDTKDATGRVRALRLDAGWGEKYDGLGEAIKAEKARLRFPEAGKVSGTEIMGGMAVGMAAGAPFGPGGMVIGGVLGAVTPAALRSPAVANAFRYTRGLRNPLNISLRDWTTAPQDSPAISPEMANIRQQQLQSLKAPERQLSYRQSLAGDIWKKLDPFAFVTDRPNPIQEWTMAQDPRGKGFRDAKGQFSLGESPYVAVRSAVSGIRGGVGVARQMMADIETDARNSGLHGETQDYLNLKAYQRAYQVVDEHMQALAQETQGLKQRLAVEDDVIKQSDLYKRIESNTLALKDMGDRYQSGKIAPGGYDPPKIQRDLMALQQKLTPDQFQKVQQFAKRVFDLNRQSLDLIADVNNNFKNGIISKDLYQQFTARGDEYIPMKRIMENLADPNAKFYGKSSPLYLRQQNVIRQLEGSERVNVDPFQASSDANSEAIREYYRNKTLGTFLDAASKSPGIADYFRKVPQDYKAPRGEMVVGMYREGQQQRYSVPKAIGESLDVSSLGQTQSALHVVNQAITRLFKGAVTVFNPAWVIGRQLPTVVGRAMLTAEGPMDPKLIASAFKDALVSAWTHDDKWMETAKTGLMRNKVLSMVYPEAKLDNARLGKLGPLGRLPLHPLEAIRGLTELPSDVLQLNHWNRLRQAGYSPEAATFKTQTRGPLPDYAQIGKMDSAVGLATTFLRAEWAHIRSDLALATDKEYRGRLAVAGMAVAIPTLALVMHNIQQTDDKGRSLWDKVADSDKEKYWNILTGTTDEQGNPNYIKIGKPDFVSTYFNPMEDAMYKMMGEIQHKNADTRPITQLIANTASRFIPGHPNFDANAFQGARATTEELAKKTASSLYQQLTPAIRLPIEEKFNATDQFGTIRPIVTNPKQSPQLQGYGAKNVSPTSMDVGRALGISPQRIEHVARGTLGATANTIESMTDPLLRADWERKMGIPLSQAQGQRAKSSPITGTPINQAEITAQNKFYSTVDQVSQPYNDYLALKKTNPVAANQYQQAHPDAVWKGQLAVELTKRLGEINQRQKEIESLQMDPASQQALSKNIHDVKMNLLNAFQGMLTPTKAATSSVGTGNATSQGVTSK